MSEAAKVHQQPLPSEEDEAENKPLQGGGPIRVVEIDELNEDGSAMILVRGKEKEVCQRALYVLEIRNPVRQALIALVEWRWFDRFIILCIAVNSILLGIYQYRAQENEDHWGLNEFIDGPADLVLWIIFTLEAMLRIGAYGFIIGKTTYLRDPWYILDFVVVVSGLIERINLGGSVGFLRLFRLLRPLRSLKAVPQMKILVNTTLSSILRLGNVVALGIFLFLVFGIVGISLMDGIFYRQCHVDAAPTLSGNGDSRCWSWPLAGDDRLCGGNYMCEASGGHCGGHEDDTVEDYRPNFGDSGMQDFPWCAGSEPSKLYPETDFVHFDHLGGAFLLIFQSMTLEGWTDLMYMVEDGFSAWFAVFFFILIVVFTNFFMLNIALAVVDEVQDEFTEQAKEEEEAAVARVQSEKKEKEGRDQSCRKAADGSAEESEEEVKDQEAFVSPYWLDNRLVKCCSDIAEDELFSNFIMFVIALNVINLCLDWYSIDDSFGRQGLVKASFFLEIVFLGIFIVEMIIMLIARGPRGYIMNSITAFDGFVVVCSIVELVVSLSGGGSGGGLSALRTFRLFRVMNKLANKWTDLRVLLKAMAKTAQALKYWLVLFVLVLYILTLMWMSIFSTQFRFADTDAVDSLYPLVPTQWKDDKWCPETEGLSWHFRQDCIPRAHFDTFLWGLATVFQVMTGENWNTIMYAGMRASERWENSLVPPTILSALLFIGMILFGQTLFMSLFLSMLISKFDEVQDEFDEKEKEKAALMTKPNGSAALQNIVRLAMQVHTDTEFTKRLRSSAPPTVSIIHPTSATESGADVPVAAAKKNTLAAVGAAALEQHQALASQQQATLPGQLPHTPPVLENDHVSTQPQCDSILAPTAPPKVSLQSIPNECATEEDGEQASSGNPCTEALEIPSQPTRNYCAENWPCGYSLCLFSEANPVRKGARWLLSWKVMKEDGGEGGMLVFDNTILLCILFATLCMMVDTPLSDPEDTGVQIIRMADHVFAVIFIVEMLVKLIAQGLIVGPDAYLKSGWNWLDGMVVLVSIIDFLPFVSGVNFLRVLRILRTFRPLRVISRNEGLKVVVQTLFQSMGQLISLSIASSLFLLIFALIFTMYLQGQLYHCSAGDNPISYLGPQHSDLGDNFRTPLCIDPSSVTVGVSMRGSYNTSSRMWNDGSCDSGQIAWQRVSADTPMCLARCDPTLESHKDIEALCGRKYTKVEELPDRCDDPTRVPKWADEEAVGVQYVNDMTRTLTVPCGGYTVESGEVVSTAASVSCRINFCPNAGEPSESCVNECKSHEFFCAQTCKDADDNTVECQACRHECEAACMCEDHCTPLIDDAALCHEQGGSWEQVLSQNFDNIFNAALTLFEISTTEGWVDVMYAASDAVGAYRQPLRDHNHGMVIWLFMLWILLSFMFLLNLVVGVLVDTFQDQRSVGNTVMVTDQQAKAQRRWINSRKTLYGRAFFFDLDNLHLLKPWRRKVYNLVSSKIFENTIIACIVLNTVILGITIFPEPLKGWKDFQTVANYIFAGVFTVEAGLKLFALRWNYFRDRWNCFDFFCVVATVAGITLNTVANVNLGGATLTIRILRIARLFRLLRFLKELNRLFSCLFRAIPRLFNVLMILILFLILFAILGMSLFGTSKFPDDGTLGVHGNFQTFFRGFVTLLRASTGEAWNEIMHDLQKDERDYFRAGDWCSPQDLFETRDADVYKVLKEKCLIEKPNACPGSWNPLATIFWVIFTMIVTTMILNLVVAVILEGYDEGKDSVDEDNIEICIEVWKKYDPDHRKEIPLPDAIQYINEVIRLIKAKAEKEGRDAPAMEMPSLQGDSMAAMAGGVNIRSAGMVHLSVTPDNKVSFLSASRQILRLNSIDQGASEEAYKALDNSEGILTRKERELLNRLEHKSTSQEVGSQDLLQNIAAMRLQRRFRERKAERQAQDKSQREEERAPSPSPSFKGPQRHNIVYTADGPPASSSSQRRSGGPAS